MSPAELADAALDLKSKYESMHLSESEFKELVQDLIVRETINNEAYALEENIKYRKIIAGIIDMAKVLA